MGNLLVGIAGSIVGGAILLLISYLLSLNVRRAITKLVGRLSGTGLTRLSKSQAGSSATELEQMLVDAQRVWIFAARGNELTTGILDPVWNRAATMEEVRIVLPDPYVRGPDSWMAYHAEETDKFDSGYGLGVLSKQIESNLEYLKERSSNLPNVSIKKADFPPIARVIVTEACAYMTMYNSKTHAREAAFLTVSNPSPIYDYCERIFRMAWRVSSEA